MEETIEQYLTRIGANNNPIKNEEDCIPQRD